MWLRHASAGVLLLALLATGCSDQREAYCDTLRDEKQTLTDLSQGAAEPAPGAIDRTLEVFERLREEAPDDVQDEWDVYITAWASLDRALDEAGADESMFADGERPEGMSQEDYDAVSAAAVDLRSTQVVQAASGIEQHALDVCKIDLGGSPLGG
jgi:hypothetical protein